MKLIIGSLKLPPLYSQENNPDPMIRCKLFSIGSSATWYLYEYSEIAPDLTPELGYGVADLGMNDFCPGYISLVELKRLSWHGIPAVERDMGFQPMKLSALLEKLEAGVHV